MVFFLCLYVENFSSIQYDCTVVLYYSCIIYGQRVLIVKLRLRSGSGSLWLSLCDCDSVT